MANLKRVFDLLDHYRGKYSYKHDALSKWHEGKWIHFSSDEYISLTDQLSLGLIESGIKTGDNIASIVLNSPEWNIIDMACMQIGAVMIPIYPNISITNYEYIFNEAEVKYIFVYNQELYDKIKPIIDKIPSLKGVYSIKQCDDINTWRQFTDLGRQSDKTGELKKKKAAIKSDDTATIIYTSGTTGRPKGVMLSHGNFLSNFLACAEIPDFNDNDRALSFLPLCHVYERMMNYLYQYFGMSVYYLENTDNLGKMIREVKPQAFCAVPRVLEKTYDKIVRKGRGLKKVVKIIFFWALELGHRYELDGKNGIWYELKLKIADILVFRKWRKALGGNIKLIVSGGATLRANIARVFWAAKIHIMEGYGLTETSPVIAVSNFEPGGIRFGTVGTVLKDVKVKIAEDGEILTKGPNLMKGYYKRPERTAEVIDSDGWFHTGDIGKLVDGKYLKITDRKKEIFKLSGGKYIAPQVLENKFKASPFIENIIILGEGHHFTSALIIPDFEHLEGWCKIKGVPFKSKEQIINNERIRNRIKQEIDNINASLDKIEQIKKFELLADEWSVESGELSPTLKLKRKKIVQEYSDIIDKFYSS